MPKAPPELSGNLRNPCPGITETRVRELLKSVSGNLRNPHEAPWLAEFERELLGFPNLRHDDQADALSQLLTWHQKRSTVAITAPELIYLDDPFDEAGGW